MVDIGLGAQINRDTDETEGDEEFKLSRECGRTMVGGNACSMVELEVKV